MRIVWSEAAIRNLVEIREYVSHDRPGAARRLGRRILAAADRLAKHPHLGYPGREPETRELIVAGTPYIVVYEIRGNLMAVLAVLHTARERDVD
jgi:toxin ParE1/3/4